jgi:hypothetical protein
MAVLIHPYARERMEERGATEAEVRTAINKGRNADTSLISSPAFAFLVLYI